MRANFSVLAPVYVNAGLELPALRAESGAGGDDAAALPKVRVAAFDVDQTLVSTRDGTWAKSADDWQPLNAHVKRTLERLHARGYVVALFSTQNLSLIHI